jgi:hypothetical protein
LSAKELIAQKMPAIFIVGSEILPPAHLSNKQVRRTEPVFLEVLTNPV